MEDNLNQVLAPAFHKKFAKKTHDSSVGSRGIQRRITRASSSSRRREMMKNMNSKDHHVVMTTSGIHEENDDDDDNDNEIESEDDVERKILALKRIVPGGESLGIDNLFEETADYIMTLQCQIKAMRALSSFLEGIEKEKRKLGG